ncbi:MAG: DUF3795 domain-containing protein [Candidatus Bathyarchaeia archaeon]|jgi:hypothetical protein
MKEELVAPCGMNCNICSSYLALENDIKAKGIKLSYCKGCRPRNKMCAFVKKRCELYLNNKVDSCTECDQVPCELLKKLSKKYEERYRMNMVENLQYIKEHGMDKFLESEQKKWKCPECGGVICCHNGVCYSCGLEKLRNKKQVYRWDDE